MDPISSSSSAGGLPTPPQSPWTSATPCEGDQLGAGKPIAHSGPPIRYASGQIELSSEDRRRSRKKKKRGGKGGGGWGWAKNLSAGDLYGGDSYEVAAAFSSMDPRRRIPVASGGGINAGGKAGYNVNSRGFGLNWGHTLSYANALVSGGSGKNGNNWFIKEIPQLYGDASGNTCAVGKINQPVWFNKTGTGSGGQALYAPRFAMKVGLKDRVAYGDYSLSDHKNRQTLYNGIASGGGSFKGVIDPKGTQTLAGYSGGKVAQFVMGGGSATAGYHYDYHPSGANAGQFQAVTYKVNGSNARRTSFGYYGSSETHGSVNDLKVSHVEGYIGGTWKSIGKSYYRYYKPGESGGFTSGLKYVVNPASYKRMEVAGLTPETATDAQVANYADHSFKYDVFQRVVEEKVNGGAQTYGLSYGASANAPNYNHWTNRTVENLPDDNQMVVYTNFAQLPILKVLVSGADKWYQYWYYDNEGKALLRAESSAVQSYSESDPGLVTLKSSDGLIYVYDYYTNSSDPGYAPGYLKAEKIKKGSGGTPITLRKTEYVQRVDSAGNETYPISKITLYRDEASGGSDPTETSFTYEWYSGSSQMKQRTTTWAVVPTAENGSGTATSKVEVFDDYGYLTWVKDESGFITYTPHDPVTGAVIKLIEDVDTSVTSGAPSGWTTPAGGGLNLVTDYEFDLLGRQTQELGPLHTIDISGTATAVRRAKWTVYLDDIHEEREGYGYATGTSPSYTFTLINPVKMTRKDADDEVVDEIWAERTSGSGKLTSSDSLPQTSWRRWKHWEYDRHNNLTEERVYFAIPVTDSGGPASNYNQTLYGYDAMNRLNRVQTPGGTITRKIYNPKGWVLEEWVGTNDSGTGADNMVKVTANVFDGGSAGGDGNLTQVTQYADVSDTRVVTYGYDWRNRKTFTDGEIDFYETYSYNNLNELIQTDRKNTSSSGNLIGRSVNKYDALSRLYQKVVYGVDPATGTVGNGLVTNLWRDPRGSVIKQANAGSQAFQKFDYDSLGRLAVQYVACDLSETGYPYPVSVAGDTVMQQVELTYDAEDNLITQVARGRFHDATGTGALTSPSGSQPKARVSYAAHYPDALGRRIASANYGTNGASSWTRSSTIPARSDTVLVATVAYNDRGEAYLATDPQGIATRSSFDDAGRITQLLENYVSGGWEIDQNRETTYYYHDNGQLFHLFARSPYSEIQATHFFYGTTLTDSGVASNELLRQKTFPLGDSDRIIYAYNRLGQVRQMTDQNNTVHAYDYDKLGRLTQDRVTTLGASIDVTVRRIERSYEVRGLLEKITSCNNATVGSGSIVNETQMGYNDFGQLAADYQAHSGVVNTSTTPKVQYGYADGSSNTIRQASMTYPNGRVLTYDFGASGGMADVLSRLVNLKEGSTIRAGYEYLGLSTPVHISYAEPGVEMTYIGGGGGDAGDQYNGLDRFGRIVDLRWHKSGTDIERVKYGYSRASNRQWRQNTVASFGQDQYYTYDGLYQIGDLKQGTLNSGHTGLTGTPSWREDIGYDSFGNWTGYDTYTDGVQSLSQYRSHNQGNEINALYSSGGGNSSSSSDGTGSLVAYDTAGNMTRAPQPGSWATGYDLKYDAWNRLVGVTKLGVGVAAYAYDGLNRRTIKTVSGFGRHYYYSNLWQVLEERVSGTTSAYAQYLWGIRAVDDVILRDKSSARSYALKDAQNVTTLVNILGQVEERFAYEAFGTPKFLYANFDPKSSSYYDWQILFGGYQLDSESGLYQVRYRYHHPSLGRWFTRDPLPGAEILQGTNLYAYVRNAPSFRIDPLGLECGDGGDPFDGSQNKEYEPNTNLHGNQSTSDNVPDDEPNGGDGKPPGGSMSSVIENLAAATVFEAAFLINSVGMAATGTASEVVNSGVLPVVKSLGEVLQNTGPFSMPLFGGRGVSPVIDLRPLGFALKNSDPIAKGLNTSKEFMQDATSSSWSAMNYHMDQARKNFK